MRLIVVAIFALLLTGCAVNGFEKYYTPARGADKISSSPYIEKPPAVPKVYAHSNDIDADAKRMAEDGYFLIGTSSFFGPSRTGTQSQAIAQGEKIGAAVILIRSTYKDTLTGTLPYTVPNAPQVATVNTSGSVNSYGSGGYANGTYSGTSTVTMPGGSTTYNIPYAIARSDFFASYWIASDPAKMRLGTVPVDLPDDVRERLKRNTGVYIRIVVHGTPAFRANVLEGDVILKINDLDVVDAKGFTDQLTQLAGQAVTLDILRGTETVTIKVTLNQNPPGVK
jgi:hypothetical protein